MGTVYDDRMSASSHRWQLSVIPVWALSALGVGWALFSPNRLQSLAVVLIVGVVLTFLAQLATRTSSGFLDRARWSVSGVVVLVTLAAGVAVLVPTGVAG